MHTAHGGHLGFLGVPGGAGGYRWLDTVLLTWTDTAA
jgi:predicted alpha/beta-fold hydrolase